MFQVLVDGDSVFEGSLGFTRSGGATKFAYHLVGTNKMVLLPNQVEDPAVMDDVFERICNEEMYMCTYLEGIHLLGLPVTKCVVQCKGRGLAKLGLYAPSLASYQHVKAHVIDPKHLLDCTWDPQSGKGVDWVPVFQTLKNDLVIALHNGLLLRGDSFHLLLAEQGSPYYCGTGVYALRYFGFHFASQAFVLQRPSPGEPHFVNVCDALAMESVNVMDLVKLSLAEAVDVMDYLLGQRVVKPQLVDTHLFF